MPLLGDRGDAVVISSRTPEGDPNRCPVCGHECRLEPSLPSRDGPCPHCGHLLWFRESARPEDPYAVVMTIVKERFGPTSSEEESAVKALVERADRKQVLKRMLTAASLAELLADIA